MNSEDFVTAISRYVKDAAIEDTIANLANFVGSGSIQKIQNTIIGVNKVTPVRGAELRAMASRAAPAPQTSSAIAAAKPEQTFPLPDDDKTRGAVQTAPFSFGQQLPTSQPLTSLDCTIQP